MIINVYTMNIMPALPQEMKCCNLYIYRNTHIIFFVLNFRVDYTAYIDKSNESPLLINSQEQTQSELPRQIGKLNILQKYHNNVFDIKSKKAQ